MNMDSNRSQGNALSRYTLTLQSKAGRLIGTKRGTERSFVWNPQNGAPHDDTAITGTLHELEVVVPNTVKTVIKHSGTAKATDSNGIGTADVAWTMMPCGLGEGSQPSVVVLTFTNSNAGFQVGDAVGIVWDGGAFGLEPSSTYRVKTVNPDPSIEYGVTAQSWQFNLRPQCNLSRHYKNSVIMLRSMHMHRPRGGVCVNPVDGSEGFPPDSMGHTSAAPFEMVDRQLRTPLVDVYIDTPMPNNYECKNDGTQPMSGHVCTKLGTMPIPQPNALLVDGMDTQNVGGPHLNTCTFNYHHQWQGDVQAQGRLIDSVIVNDMPFIITLAVPELEQCSDTADGRFKIPEGFTEDTHTYAEPPPLSQDPLPAGSFAASQPVLDDEWDPDTDHVPSTPVTVGGTQGNLKWSDSPFQISLLPTDGVETGDGACPEVGSIMYWNGKRCTDEYYVSVDPDGLSTLAEWLASAPENEPELGTDWQLASTGNDFSRLQGIKDAVAAYSGYQDIEFMLGMQKATAAGADPSIVVMMDSYTEPYTTDQSEQPTTDPFETGWEDKGGVPSMLALAGPTAADQPSKLHVVLPPTVMFPGAPAQPDAVCVDPNNLARIWFFKDDDYNVYSLDAPYEKISGPHDIKAQFGSHLVLPLKFVYRGSGPQGGTGLFNDLRLHDANDMLSVVQADDWSIDTSNSFFYSDASWKSDYTAAALNDTTGRIKFKSNSVSGDDLPGGFSPFGTGQTLFPNLPHNVTGVTVDQRTSGGWGGVDGLGHIAFNSGKMYVLDVPNGVVTSTHEYGTSSQGTDPATQGAVFHRKKYAYMDGGNWIDGSYYDLKIDLDSAKNGGKDVWRYGADPTENPTLTENVNWTITGWGNTVLYGNAYHIGSTNKTRLVLNTDPETNKPQYYPFVPSSFAPPANAQEAFNPPVGSGINCDIYYYEFDGQPWELMPGATLTPHFSWAGTQDPTFSDPDSAALHSAALQTNATLGNLLAQGAKEEAPAVDATPSVYLRKLHNPYTLGPNRYDYKTPPTLGMPGLEQCDWTIELEVQMLENCPEACNL